MKGRNICYHILTPHHRNVCTCTCIVYILAILLHSVWKFFFFSLTVSEKAICPYNIGRKHWILIVSVLSILPFFWLKKKSFTTLDSLWCIFWHFNYMVMNWTWEINWYLLFKFKHLLDFFLANTHDIN